MKAKLSTPIERVKRPYPKLMLRKEDSIVVLFTKENCGFIVYNNEIGHYNDHWIMHEFTDLDPEFQVILQND